MEPITVVVDRLPPEGEQYTVELGAAELDRHFAAAGVPGVRGGGPLRARVRVLPSGRDVFVLGDLDATVQYECVRCLTAFAGTVRAEFHLTYCREPEGVGGGELELHREDLDVERLAGNVLELLPVLYEQLDLALDTHPVCREGCKGLCPRCGADRNRGECRCGGAAVDPRFAALRDWAAKGSGSKER
ncbi:MAG: hypothetical protein Kow0092_20270 [Deferrisomatales bacterium]